MLNSIVAEEKSKSLENSESQQLFKSIKQKIELIRANPQYGDAVPKKLIPKKIPVDNLWVVDLIRFWRMLYTLKGSQIEILCFILEICDHDRYNNIFGYRKK
ncbi:hypothetical protein A3K64_03105 [Candidatus Micrarchaeota archaeon RBG_16_36_9]|nr:MAG: hypothetical protein A3K64_03105 [Candidatus Micrarchaeota archaeon RBG_16_36_9]